MLKRNKLLSLLVAVLMLLSTAFTGVVPAFADEAGEPEEPVIVTDQENDPEEESELTDKEPVDETEPIDPDLDTDFDGIPDVDEITVFGTDPENADTDGDGLSDYDELYVYYTAAGEQDSDGDGLSDYDELFTYGTDPLKGDTDSDGVSDGDELYYGTDPMNRDTDGDGITDGEEFLLGTDPKQPEDISDVFQSIGEGTIDGALYVDNAAIPAIEGYAPFVLYREAVVTHYDAESFRHNPALIGKAIRVTIPECGNLTLTFTVDSSAKEIAVYRRTDANTVRLNAEKNGNTYSVPFSESGVYFVADQKKLNTLLGLEGAAPQNLPGNSYLLDDFHYVTLNAPLTSGSGVDTDGDGVPDSEEIGEAYEIDLGNGKMTTVYAFRSDPTLPDTDFDGIPDNEDNAPENNVFTGKMKSGHDDMTTVSFTVDYRNFFAAKTEYQPTLATYSVMGAALAYMDKQLMAYDNAYLIFDNAPTAGTSASTKYNGKDLMELFGFEDVQDYRLSSDYYDDDMCEAVIGHQTVTYNGETKIIMAIWVRGTDSSSEEEWSSNFHMGRLEGFFDEYDSVSGKSPRQKNEDWTRKTNHRGFDVCATRILKFAETYYNTYIKQELENNPDAGLAYWITGHSRGAAVGNLIASYLIDLENEVYAYTFATPYNTANTEASAEKYDSIFNLVNANDFVPMLPMIEWGFTRYGKTATVDASQWSTQIKNATGADYSGNYLSASDMNTLLGKFICITGENADRNNPGKILGWRDVYTYHCGHQHADETVGNYQSTTFCKKQSLTNWGGPSQSSYNGYSTRLRKYSYWTDGICETPAYNLQVLVELLVAVARGETLGGASTYITSNKLADKFDFDKWSLISYATKLTEPHFMDTYSVIQAQINAAGDPGSRFVTLSPYTTSGANGGRPAHTHTYIYVPYSGQVPTCTEDGLGYRYCLCSETNADYYDDYQKNVKIPATGHEWGTATYTWAQDGNAWTCTASRACSSCHETETETVTAVRTEEGETVTYTATFENEAFEEQTKTGILAYYLIGLNDWTNVTAEHKFEPNPENAVEYMLAITLAEGDEFKAVQAEIVDGVTTILTWYPDGMGNNYVVGANQAGDVTVYFRPDGQGGDGWHYGYLYIAVPVIEEPEFMSQALALEGQIGVYFYVKLPANVGYEYEGVDFTISSTDGTPASVPFSPDMPTNSKGYYQFAYYVRSIEMADTITATLNYTVNGEAKTLEKTYSVKQYFETFDNNLSLFNEKMQAMTKATADYGHYVQAFLETQRTWTIGTDYAEMDKHYTDYTADDIAAAQTGLADYAAAKTVGSNMEKVTYTLVLDSDTELRVYFKPAADYTGTFTFTVNGETVTEDGEKISVKLQSDGRYMVSIRNIAAHELSNVYEVKAVGDGVESSMTVSALTYVNAIMTSYAGNTTAINAAVAIYRYAMAAKALRPGA